MIYIGHHLERLVILIFAGMAVYLGFRLFYIATEKQGELKVNGKDFRLSLADVAPGIYFALFGSFILTVSLFKPVESSQFEHYSIGTNGQPVLLTTTSKVKGLSQDGQIASVFVDFDNPLMRKWEPGKQESYLKIIGYRNTLRQSISDGTASDFWKSDSTKIIKHELDGFVSEKHFKEMLSEANSLSDLQRFLEAYIPFFYLRYSN